MKPFINTYFSEGRTYYRLNWWKDGKYSTSSHLSYSDAFAHMRLL